MPWVSTRASRSWHGRRRAWPDATRVTLGGSNLDELATRLLALAVPLAVVAPDELRTVLRTRLRSQLNALTPDS